LKASRALTGVLSICNANICRLPCFEAPTLFSAPSADRPYCSVRSPAHAYIIHNILMRTWCWPCSGPPEATTYWA